ncbi:FKBP-type peptidyl-prolyl cis-trans isomerase [Leptospira kobayashii]|nr:peptidylprolyl isomerase [Leptospira kobayashii]
MNMSNSISKGKVVGFSYHLTNSQGATLDKSDEPLLYLHGSGNIIPGLENELEGLVSGDSKKVVVSPENGYGTYDEKLVFQVPKSELPADAELEVGMEFQTDSADGPMVLYLHEVRETDVILNGNHPLAGETLHFDVTIQSIREATKEELKHGHVHGPGGHHHH